MPPDRLLHLELVHELQAKDLEGDAAVLRTWNSRKLCSELTTGKRNEFIRMKCKCRTVSLGAEPTANSFPALHMIAVYFHCSSDRDRQDESDGAPKPTPE